MSHYIASCVAHVLPVEVESGFTCSGFGDYKKKSTQMAGNVFVLTSRVASLTRLEGRGEAPAP